MKPTVLDLFSGIGGFSLAFEREGFETIGFSEIDPYASAVLKKHWPNIPNYGPIQNVKRGCGLEYFDVLTGGVPCQPSSTAGQMRGSKDERWLWPEAVRVLSDFRPQFAIFENPTGIFTVEDGYAFNGIISSIASVGYCVWWEVVPACSVGAPHQRERVFIVAYRNQDGCDMRQSGRKGIHRSEQARHEADSGVDDASNANCFGSSKSTKQEGTEAPIQSESEKRSERFSDDSDSNQTGLNREGIPECTRKGLSDPSGVHQADANTNEKRFKRGFRETVSRKPLLQIQPERVFEDWQHGWPVSSPFVCRVDDGIPDRVDRLQCLGNSIVPQVAQVFAKAIYQQIVK